MKRFIVCGFLMFLLVAPCTPASSQESEPDKKALREQRREERRQKREERKQERQNGETQKEVLPVTTGNTPQNTTSKNAVTLATQQSVQVQQKQQTPVKSKEETPIIKAPATTNSSRPSQSIEKTAEQSVRTTASESDASQSPSDDNFSSFVGFFVLAVLIIWILSKIFTRKCSHCKKYRAMVPIEETYLGRVKTERVKDSQGHVSFVHYNRMQVTRECKYCGYQDRVIKTVKGDRE